MHTTGNTTNTVLPIKVRHLNIGPNMVFYLVDRYEVVVIAVMHCKQSSYVINRAIRYALMNF